MEKKHHTNLRELLEHKKQEGSLRVKEANQTLKDFEGFMDDMKKIREEYERKSADSVRVLRDRVFK